jgi:hypothetical protein
MYPSARSSSTNASARYHDHDSEERAAAFSAWAGERGRIDRRRALGACRRRATARWSLYVVCGHNTSTLLSGDG